MLYFKVNSSRDTNVGLFRAGMVYAIDKTNDKAMRAVKPHLEKGGAFKKLTAKAMTEEIKSAALKVGPANDLAEEEGETVVTDEATAAKIAEYEAALQEAKKRLDAIPEDDERREEAVAEFKAIEADLAEIAG